MTAEKAAAAREVLSFPCHPHLTDVEVRSVVDAQSARDVLASRTVVRRVLVQAASREVREILLRPPQ